MMEFIKTALQKPAATCSGQKVCTKKTKVAWIRIF